MTLKTWSFNFKFLNFSRALSEKNKSLKKNLYVERQSRENLEKEVNEFRDFGNDKFKESWQNISDLHAMIQDKEITIQSLKFNQQKEVEDLRHKLYQRDQTLRKVLESKITATSKWFSSPWASYKFPTENQF